MVRKRNLLIILLFFSFINCSGSGNQSSSVRLNIGHLDHLYQEISVEGKTLGIIHIYSEYPDYRWVGDEDEGIACIDDAARAAIFYMKYSSHFNDPSSRVKAEELVEFVLHMQAENGFFYNFIWHNYSTNKTHQNSVAEPNWWSWRALWCLTEAHEYFKYRDEELTARIKSAILKTTEATKAHFRSEKKVIELNGFIRPTWLPYRFASDQAALIVIALCNYYKSFNDAGVLQLIGDLCDGILLMQEGDERNFPYSAFMSWENTWHAWGNAQSYSLLKAYEITRNEKYLNSALNEMDRFYMYALGKKFFNEFSIKKENGKTVPDTEKKFSQIAYGIRPMVYAAVKGAELTGDEKYSKLAAEIAAWFFGNNPANAQMYSSQNGVCFDGVISEKEVNKNSGAESTIEALLSLLAIESNSIAKNKLNELLTKKSVK